MIEAEALCIATHRHYKGGLYKYLFTALHTETGEAMIIYQHVWPHRQAYFARPASIWNKLLPSGGERFVPLPNFKLPLPLGGIT